MSAASNFIPLAIRRVLSRFFGGMTPLPGGCHPIPTTGLIQSVSSLRQRQCSTGGWKPFARVGLIHPQLNHVLRRVSPFGGMTLFAVYIPHCAYNRHTASDFVCAGGKSCLI